MKLKKRNLYRLSKTTSEMLNDFLSCDEINSKNFVLPGKYLKRYSKENLSCSKNVELKKRLRETRNC